MLLHHVSLPGFVYSPSRGRWREKVEPRAHILKMHAAAYTQSQWETGTERRKEPSPYNLYTSPSVSVC